MAKLALFFLTALLLRAELSHGYTDSCEWLGSWPFCNPDDCSDGFMELGRQQVGASDLAPMERGCFLGMKRLCCDKEIIKGDLTRDCHWTKGWENVKKETKCPEGQIMLFKNYRMSKLALFFLTALLLQAELSHGFTDSCEWLGSWPFCNPDYCSEGFVDMGRQQVGASDLAPMERGCILGMKRLCCKKEIIKGDARKDCHWTKGWENVKKATKCPDGQIMLLKNYKTDHEMLCCDREFFVDGFST